MPIISSILSSGQRRNNAPRSIRVCADSYVDPGAPSSPPPVRSRRSRALHPLRLPRSSLGPRRRPITGPALEKREARGAVDVDVATPTRLKDVALAEVSRLKKLEEEALARVLEIRRGLVDAARDIYVIEMWENERAEAEAGAEEEEEEERSRMMAAMASAQGGGGAP